MKKSILISVILVFCAGIGWAQTTYYVATNGDDTASGLDWANALLTISNAVAKATNAGDIVMVSNGTYSINAQIEITNGITVQSTNGWQVTTVKRSGAANHRIFYCSNDTAVIDGFTIRDGNVVSEHGGGVYMAGGTLQNCFVISNSANSSLCGGAIYLSGNSTVSNCTVTGSQGCHYSGGIYIGGAGPKVLSCVISNNTTQIWGGGIYMNGGTVENCLIVRNRIFYDHVSYNGGGVRINGGMLCNCTIADNTALETTPGAGVYRGGGGITNCIIYHNLKGVVADDIAGTIAGIGYSCSPALSGSGNISEEPDFIDRNVNNYQLQLSSPCIDAGTNLAAVTTDLNGTTRPLDGYNSGIAVSDMGAYEAPALTNNPFRCGFIASTRTGMDSLQVVFTAYVGGTNTSDVYYEWDFEYDGTNDIAGQGRDIVTNTYPAGTFTVGLLVSNAAAEVATLVRSNYIQIASSVVYVDVNGSHTPPYNTWSKAATNLADALALTGDGMNVYVTNGIYTARNISIPDAVTVQSINGASFTILKGSVEGGRLFYVTHSNTFIDGFTLTGANLTAGSGSAVCLEGGTVRNCVVISNAATAASQGGAIYATGNSLVENCLIVKNSGVHFSGGIWLGGSGSLVRNCVISNNTALYFGGGVYANASDATIRNCLIVHNNLTGNHSSYAGGGVYMTSGVRLENCTVAHNTTIGDTPGAGIKFYGGAITNTIVYYNTRGGTNDNINAAGYNNVGYSCATELTNGVNNNITNEPMFTATNKLDYTLMGNSHCVNTGTNMTWMTGALDLAGKVRINMSTVDMGCYEWQPPSGMVFMCR